MPDDGDSGNDGESDDSSDRSSVRKGIGAAGKSLSESGARQLGAIAAQASERSSERSPNSDPPRMQSYKRGGKVRKTGKALLHRGEKVRPAKRKRGRGRRAKMTGRY